MTDMNTTEAVNVTFAVNCFEDKYLSKLTPAEDILMAVVLIFVGKFNFLI